MDFDLYFFLDVEHCKKKVFTVQVHINRDKPLWPGARIRKKGEGMPNYNNNNLVGTLYITFDVYFPKDEFSSEQKQGNDLCTTVCVLVIATSALIYLLVFAIKYNFLFFSRTRIRKKIYIYINSTGQQYVIFHLPQKLNKVGASYGFITLNSNIFLVFLHHSRFLCDRQLHV